MLGKAGVRARGKNLWVLSRPVVQLLAHGSVELVFEVDGTEVAQRAMEALAVVACLNVGKDLAPGFFVTAEVPPVDQFAFESAPERFHGRIVIATGSPAH